MHKTLTLLVTLKDRFEFTERLYTYLCDTEFPFSVLFADGSLDNKAEVFFREVSSGMPSNFTYIRYPKDETLPNYYKKCADAISLVKTPYVMLADNDDFPLPEGQKKAIDFLEKNPEYIGCNGRVAGMILSPYSSSPYGENLLYLQYYCNGMDREVPLDHKSGLDRINSYLTNFYSVFYSVFRTDPLKEGLQEIHRFNFSELGIVELFLSMYLLAQGKVHTIESITYIRQKGSSQAAASQKNWFERLFYTNWLEDLKECITCVTKEISQQEKLKHIFVQEKLYKNFVQIFQERFLHNTWYIFKNMSTLLNRENFRLILLSKIFYLFPWAGEKISLLLLSKPFRKSFKVIRPYTNMPHHS